MFKRLAIVALLTMLVSPALAGGDVVFLSGGCGSGSIGTNGNPYMTVDGAGRNCIGLYYSYSNITSNATTTVKTGAGILHSITVNTKGASSNTATLYDNTAASGTKIGTLDTTSAVGAVLYDVAFANGLTVVTATGTAPDITVSYK